ncbi:MAG: hypothetical protein U0521_07090 [Anaerolineae bacterium]
MFYAPFFLFPVALYRFAFPMSEVVMLITAAAWSLRALAAWGRSRQSAAHFPARSIVTSLRPLDYGVAVLVLLGALSLAWAEQRGAALTELRTLLVEPALFYLRFCAQRRATVAHAAAAGRCFDNRRGAGRRHRAVSVRQG